MSTSNWEIFTGSSCSWSCEWVFIRWWSSDESSPSTPKYGHGLLPKEAWWSQRAASTWTWSFLVLCPRSHSRSSSNLWLPPLRQPSCCSGGGIMLVEESGSSPWQWWSYLTLLHPLCCRTVDVKLVAKAPALLDKFDSDDIPCGSSEHMWTDNVISRYYMFQEDQLPQLHAPICAYAARY